MHDYVFIKENKLFISINMTSATVVYQYTDLVQRFYL